jgi:hypothetical protein
MLLASSSFFAAIDIKFAQNGLAGDQLTRCM